MLINEIITEALSRRDFMRGAVSAAALAATGQALAGPGGQHLPPEFDFEYGTQWKKMDPQKQQQWIQRQKNLLARSNQVFKKLVSVMDEEQKKYITGAVIDVPLTHALYDMANVGANKKISMDLGTFWDLSNDTIGYTIGHELGHIYFNGIKKHPFTRGNDTPALRKLNVQSELDCDEFGAKLAFKAGFDPKLAFSQMTQKQKSWKYNPNVKADSYYPDHNMRTQTLDRTINSLKNPPEQPQQSSQQNQEQDAITQINAGKELFSHIQRGILAMANA